jgi:FkbM family methyltransferase
MSRAARVLELVGGPGLALLGTLARPGDVVVDAGANFGLFAERLSQLVGPEGTVLAFEPNPNCAPHLEALAANAGNVVVYPLALSDRRGTAVLHVPVRGARRIDALGRLAPTGADEERYTVETARLDDIAASVDFIKCDVEGHELAVLRGANATLVERRPRLFVEMEWRHAGDEMQETFRYLAGLGYAGSALGPTGLVPLDDFDLERDQLGHLDDASLPDRMPPAYVNDFVFRMPER